MAKRLDETQYVPGQSVAQAQQNLEQYQQQRPGAYQSQYQGQMDNLLQQYQNRPAFQYDVNADALFQQAAQRFQQQGQKAMMDTVGQVSSLTGGYGNSYAQTAGQQAYQGMIQGLYDNLPQYYQMAADQYDRQGNNLLQQYNLMANREQQEYGRYQDAMDRYNQELGRLQGVYDTERNYDYNIFADQRGYDWQKYTDDANREYQANRDAVADQRWQTQWDYTQQQDALENSRYDQKLAQAQVDAMLAMGAEIPDALLKASGYDPAYLAAVRAGQAGYGGGGGAGSSGSVADMLKKYSYGAGKYYSGPSTSGNLSADLAQFRQDAASVGMTEADIQQKVLQLAGEYYQRTGRNY